MHHRWPDAFAVLGIFADGDVDQAVVDDRRADDVVPRGPVAGCSSTSSDWQSNFHSSLALPLPSPSGAKL